MRMIVGGIVKGDQYPLDIFCGPLVQDGMRIRQFRPGDEAEVVDLWNECGLVVPWNDPHKDIARKLAVQPELLLVAERMEHASGAGEPRIVGTVMIGYDGHRGQINYLAVRPGVQRQGLGRALIDEAERMLRARGCPKINLQVRTTNAHLIEFYQHLGFRTDAVVHMGKRLEDDETPNRRTR